MSWGDRNEMPQIGRLRSTKTYSLPALEAPSLGSSCGQGRGGPPCFAQHSLAPVRGTVPWPLGSLALPAGCHTSLRLPVGAHASACGSHLEKLGSGLLSSQGP